jgi:hemerythrin-like metal-binding protein
MSTISDFNDAAHADMDREHQVQLSLLRSLCQATREQRDTVYVTQLLDQLTAYCEAHFVSEELIMRQHSYADYEDHADDHCHMMGLLRTMAIDRATGNSSALTAITDEALAFIETHIATRDKRFTDFMRSLE